MRTRDRMPRQTPKTVSTTETGNYRGGRGRRACAKNLISLDNLPPLLGFCAPHDLSPNTRHCAGAGHAPQLYASNKILLFFTW